VTDYWELQTSGWRQLSRDSDEKKTEFFLELEEKLFFLEFLA
jgi:hypothetical protein